jgi:hypothetical protein
LSAAVVGAGLLVAAAPTVHADDVTVYREQVYSGAEMMVTGRGHGSGRGLAQAGAEQLAAQGSTAQQILDFYYPGTTPGTSSDEDLVRVKLALVPTAAVTVIEVPGLQIQDAATGAVTSLGDDHVAYRIVRDGTAMAVQGTDGSGVWVPITLTGGTSTATGPLTFAGPEQQRLAYLDNRVDVSMAYHGTITALPGTATSLVTVNTTSIRNFLYDSIEDVSFHVEPDGTTAITLTQPQARLAQLIALRSYLESLRGTTGLPWDVVNAGPNSQRLGSRGVRCDPIGNPADAPAPCIEYLNVARYSGDTVRQQRETASTRALVDGAAGQIRTYQGAPISGQYTESNGGWTSGDPAHPYLVAKADPTGTAEANWTARFDPTYTLAVCHPEFAHLNTTFQFAVLGREGGGLGGGRITGVRIDGAIGTTRIQYIFTGLTLIQCLRRSSVESPFFAITAKPAAALSPAVGLTSRGVAYILQSLGEEGLFINRGGIGSGTTNDIPSMALLPNGKFRIFITGTNGSLYSQDLQPGGLSAVLEGRWHNWGGSIVGRPAPVVMPDRSIGVYAHAANGRVYQAAFTAAGAFRGWFNLGGPALVPGTGPGATSTGSGGVLLAVNGGPTGIWARSYVPNRGWGAWASIGGSALGSPALASPAAGVAELYTTAPATAPANRDIRVRRYVKGVWSGTQSLGGQAIDAPAAIYSNGRIGLIVLGADYSPYLRIRTASGWGPWRAMS